MVFMPDGKAGSYSFPFPHIDFPSLQGRCYTVSLFANMEFKDRLCHVQELSSPRIIGTCAASGLALFYMSQARRAAASRVRPMQARKDMMAVFTCNKCGRLLNLPAHLMPAAQVQREWELMVPSM